ncbi:MAG: prepilin-type N-terminal cleavage/methylation domain-containing protein [bacterium]|nr:prepilin-type N-terminal cleavage/methylation domain-containing protein [bacterium]
MLFWLVENRASRLCWPVGLEGYHIHLNIKGDGIKSLKKGYTLIELIVVIGVIVILTALAMPQVNGIQERSSLTTAAETIRQAVIEARTDAIAPRGGNVGRSNFTAFEIKFINGITKKNEQVKTTSGSNAVVTNSPVEIQGIVTACDNRSNQLSSTLIKSIDFSDGIMIDGFSPEKLLESIKAGTEELIPVDGDTSKKITRTGVRFTLANFDITCGGTKSVDSQNAELWDSTKQENTFRVKLKNIRYEKIKNTTSSDTEFMYVNINKYSGQVWISREASESTDMAVFPDNSSAESLIMQDSYWDAGGGDWIGNILRVNDGNQSFVMFDWASLTDPSEPNKFPKRARLWLTTGDIVTAGSLVDIYMLKPDSDLEGNCSESSPTFSDCHIYAEAGANRSEVGELVDVEKNTRYSIEFNLARHKAWWNGTGSIDYDLPLVFYLTSGDSVEFLSKEKYDSEGSVSIEDEGGGTGGDSSVAVRPAPVLELLY